MGKHRSKQRRKRVRDTDASIPIISTEQRHGKSVELQSGECESESPLLLPPSDSVEKIDVPSASGANSDPSASSTCMIGSNYHVFLSFRDPDTRKGFVDHLYHRLNDVGLRFHPNFVFRDDENLRFGEPIAENLLNAIERSKVSIPVISENYAASEWCLRELIHIMVCKESGGQMVLPVLYKVKPKDVKHMLGKFGKAYKSSMHRFKEDVKQQGPEALRKALTLRVYESEGFASGCEGELVNELVEIILREQQHDFPPHLPVNLVAIEDPVAEVMKLVDLACPDTRIIGIWGMGGIGKTTLATIIYKMLFDKFKCRSFLKDIRETINREGVKHVQSLLLPDIRKGPKSTVHDPEMGINMIRLSCEKMKVLILLDDVDHSNHLNNLIGGCKFSLGSRIIFTSQHKAINCQDKAMLESTFWYELQKMNFVNSLLLFSIHAFEKEPPPKQLATLSRDIVAIIGGLPLALTVISSRLKGEEDQEIWGEMLEKLRNVPDEEVQQRLRISYDSLDDVVKKMFLDIACIFIGIDKRIAPYLWDHKLCPRIGLKKLIDRSLIYVNHKLTMHDELRDLGRAIARPANKNLWDCSRLWEEEEAMIVLRRKEKNENIEALRLDEMGSTEFIEQESFKKMPNLKFLHVKDVDFDGDFEGSLIELRWLKWERCPDSFKATNVHLEKLVVLDLSGDFSRKTYISENWKGWSSIKMERLKVLNLSRCLELKSTPNLSAFKNLEILILEFCNRLKIIDPSIGKLNKLKILKISHSGIERLPSSIGKLQSLQELDANQCCRLEGQILVDKGGWSPLKTLRLRDTKISGLPENLNQLSSLEYLDLWCCHELESLPKPPCSLSYLELTCWSDELPSLSHLKHLQQLTICNCMSLQSIPELPSCIRTLYVWVCPKLQRLPNLSNLEFLSELRLASCNGLKQFDGLEALKSLKMLGLHRDPFPFPLEGYDPNAEPDDVHEIRGLEKLGSLEVLDISERKHIQVLDLSKSKHLKRLIVKNCKSLVEIHCRSEVLELFDWRGCESLEKFPDFCVDIWPVSHSGRNEMRYLAWH